MEASDVAASRLRNHAINAVEGEVQGRRPLRGRARIQRTGGL